MPGVNLGGGYGGLGLLSVSRGAAEFLRATAEVPETRRRGREIDVEFLGCGRTQFFRAVLSGAGAWNRLGLLRLSSGPDELFDLGRAWLQLAGKRSDWSYEPPGRVAAERNCKRQTVAAQAVLNDFVRSFHS